MSKRKAPGVSVNLKKGDYVLATKWQDGDPGDQWCVGLYDRQEGDRHFVVNSEGKQFRMNGFRRVKKISVERGAWLIRHIPTIERFMRAGSRRSVWGWARLPLTY